MRQFKRLLVAGTGNVVAERIRPAVSALVAWHPLDSVTYFDVTPRPVQFELGGLPVVENFIRITDSDSAVRQLMARGALGNDTVLMVCAPSAVHVPYARRFAEYVGRVGVEKPLSLNPGEAATLADFEARVFPINHQLWKPAMLCWASDCHFGRFDLGRVDRLEFVLHETKGVGARTIDDAIWDLGWHGFECALSPLVAAGLPVSIEIHDVRSATYADGPDSPRRSTATRIASTLHTDSRDIPLTISVGKGQGHVRKYISAFDRNDELIRFVPLDDPSNQSHRFALRELLSATTPFMPVGLRHVLRVVEACSEASARCTLMPPYQFGSTPDWLSDLSRMAAPVAA